MRSTAANTCKPSLKVVCLLRVKQSLENQAIETTIELALTQQEIQNVKEVSYLMLVVGYRYDVE